MDVLIYHVSQFTQARLGVNRTDHFTIYVKLHLLYCMSLNSAQNDFEMAENTKNNSQKRKELYSSAARKFFNIAANLDDEQTKLALIYLASSSVQKAANLSEKEIEHADPENLINNKEPHQLYAYNGRLAASYVKERTEKKSNILKSVILSADDILNDIFLLEKKLETIGIPPGSSKPYIDMNEVNQNPMKSVTGGEHRSRYFSSSLGESFMVLPTEIMRNNDSSMSCSALSIAGDDSFAFPSFSSEPHPASSSPQPAGVLAPSHPKRSAEYKSLRKNESLTPGLLSHSPLSLSSSLAALDMAATSAVTHTAQFISAVADSRGDRAAPKGGKGRGDSDTLRQLEETNRRLARRVEALVASEARMTSETAGFRMEYHNRFQRLKEFLATQYPLLVQQSPPPPGQASPPAPDERQQQLEKTVRALLARLNEAKSAIEKKDKLIAKYEKLLRKAAKAPQEAEESPVPPPAPTSPPKATPAASSVRPHLKHPSTCTLETSLRRTSAAPLGR